MIFESLSMLPLVKDKGPWTKFISISIIMNPNHHLYSRLCCSFFYRRSSSCMSCSRFWESKLSRRCLCFTTWSRWPGRPSITTLSRSPRSFVRTIPKANICRRLIARFCLQELEEGGGPYLCGDQYSLADISMVKNIFFIPHMFYFSSLPILVN